MSDVDGVDLLTVAVLVLAAFGFVAWPWFWVMFAVWLGVNWEDQRIGGRKLPLHIKFEREDKP